MYRIEYTYDDKGIECKDWFNHVKPINTIGLAEIIANEYTYMGNQEPRTLASFRVVKEFQMGLFSDD